MKNKVLLPSWIYQNKIVTTIEEIANIANLSVNSLYGFVYGIHFQGNKFYIGKKNFFNTKELHCLKNGTKRENHVRFIGRIVDHKRTTLEVVQNESDWLSYYGSLKDTRGLIVLRRKILDIAISKRQLTYLEVFWQFRLNVLQDSRFLNENILGKFFRNNIT
ncbi:MAG: hypothetical protein IJU79_02250 [Desulfovibrionaceae bacterium]|nr:hypothetical protein [Desulfovibrionaceae bacterium]